MSMASQRKLRGYGGPLQLSEKLNRDDFMFDRFVASQTINVRWGWYSVVEPDVVCLQVRVTRMQQILDVSFPTLWYTTTSW